MNVDPARHGGKVANYVKKYPYQTGIQIASLVVPGLMRIGHWRHRGWSVPSFPQVKNFGVSHGDPGSVAAVTQSAISPIAARSIFAFLEKVQALAATVSPFSSLSFGGIGDFLDDWGHVQGGGIGASG